MEKVKHAVLNGISLSNDQIIEAFQMIGSRGDIVIIKNDGLRSENKYTVVISSPSEKFASIRLDAESLEKAFSNCLNKYFESIVDG
jgi:hypothetical protein